jgi:histidinol dehydrogenase
MLAIPAQIANVKEIVICSPPNSNGKIDERILYLAGLLNIREIYRVGGAQAIAAMAYGTDSIGKVDKIFGPGNSYVTLAKQMVQQDGVAIDMPAGPSELAVIADDNANAEFVAADLLSQAEHGADSQILLLCQSKEFAEEVIKNCEKFIEKLDRKEYIFKSLEQSVIYVSESIDELFDISNNYAPEHLSLQISNALQYVDKVKNAASVFIGKYAAESFADYCSGTNHTLPTQGFAKAYSGISLQSYMKTISFQEIHENDVLELAPAAICMANEESLQAHALAASLRLQNLSISPNKITFKNKITSIH